TSDSKTRVSKQSAWASLRKRLMAARSKSSSIPGERRLDNAVLPHRWSLINKQEDRRGGAVRRRGKSTPAENSVKLQSARPGSTKSNLTAKFGVAQCIAPVIL